MIEESFMFFSSVKDLASCGLDFGGVLKSASRLSPFEKASMR